MLGLGLQKARKRLEVTLQSVMVSGCSGVLKSLEKRSDILYLIIVVPQLGYNVRTWP